MIRLKAALIILLLSLAMPAMAEDDLLIQIVVDDTGALQDGEDPHETKTARDSFVKLLAHVGKTYGRGTRVIVVSQHGGRNIWTGDSRQMVRTSQNASLEAFVVSKWGGCSDLNRVPSILDENIYLYPAKQHHFIFFSSLIHTGLPCAAENFSLDNLVPPDFLDELGGLIQKHSAKYSFYWVYDDAQSSARSRLVEFARNLGVRGVIQVETETRSGNF